MEGGWKVIAQRHYGHPDPDTTDCLKPDAKVNSCADNARADTDGDANEDVDDPAYSRKTMVIIIVKSTMSVVKMLVMNMVPMMMLVMVITLFMT